MKRIFYASFACALFFCCLNAAFIPLSAVSYAERIEAYKQINSLNCSPAAITFNVTTDSEPWYIEEWTHLYAPPRAADQNFNTLFIPDTLGGTNIYLRIHDSSNQYLVGTTTATFAFNNCAVLGPTLVLHQGTAMQMHVKNDLSDTTTIHWHGMHLPAIMDGGPHQPIAPGTTWSPSWSVTNNAGTYWYHPHLHMKTTEQIVKGLAGLIIVRDPTEEALRLPRTYGVDDIPLILNDKSFESSTNQLLVTHYGDTMMCNGTLNAKFNVPAQVVRFRILDAAQERSYNVGFSDGRKFYVIASDAGLLEQPVGVKRYVLSAGERIEILVDFSGQENQQVTLRAFNSGLDPDIPGGEPDNTSTRRELRNDLGARDFDILRLNITGTTNNPVTTIPATLVSITPPDSSKATATRSLQMVNEGTNCSLPSYGCYSFNGQSFDMNRIDYRVEKDATEIWQITNNTNTSHPFHLHDVSFMLMDKSNEPVPAYEKGWKDVILVRKGATVRFIAKFADYADSVHPYMYHCHITLHEDAGMMGQFVVVPPPAINIGNARTKEGNSGTKTMNFTVTLGGTSRQTVTVHYKTKDGTAVSPADYTASEGTLTFQAGETAKTLAVTVNGDLLQENDETLKVILSDPQHAVLEDHSGKGTIRDDDAVAPTAGTAGTGTTEAVAQPHGIRLSPNPVTDMLRIDGLNEEIPSAISVVDIDGRILSHVSVHGPVCSLPVRALAAGYYYIKVVTGEHIVTLQFIKR